MFDVEIIGRMDNEQYIIRSKHSGKVRLIHYSDLLEYEAHHPFSIAGIEMINACNPMFILDKSKYFRVNEEKEFKLYPNSEQVEQIEKTFNQCILIWNRMLMDSIRYYYKYRKKMNLDTMTYKRQYESLYEADWYSLNDEKSELSRQFDEFIRGDRKNVPEYKSLDSKYKAFGIRNYAIGKNDKPVIQIKRSQVKLPKIGWVEMEPDVRIHGSIKHATVYRVKPGEYKIKFRVETWEKG